MTELSERPLRRPPPGAIEIPALPPAHGGGPVLATESPAAAGRRRGGQLWWLVLLLPLAGLFWGFITIRPVEMTTTPQAEILRMTGGHAWRSGGTWYLTAGNWQIHAEAAGFAPLDAPFQVSRTGVNSFHFSLIPLPGTVTPAAVDTTTDAPVAGVFWYADGKPMTELTPFPPGAVTISAEHPDYLAASAAVTIQGHGVHQDLLLRLTPRRGLLAIPELAAAAKVAVDDTFVAAGPGEWLLEPGDRRLMITMAGCQPWQRTVVIRSGERTVVDHIELLPIPATVLFESTPPGAQILLDEALTGVAPFSRDLTPGVYAARAVLPAYQPADILLDVKAGEKRTASFVLQAITGELSVNAPPDAEIWIDGKRFEQPMPVILPTGPHQVEVRMAGYPPYQRQVLVRSDRRAELTVTPPAKPEVPDPAAGGSTEGPPPGPPFGITLIAVQPPATAFAVGSSRSEAHRRSNETLRQVLLTRPFEMGRYEITNSQFRQFAAAHRSPEGMDGDDQPAVNVTWDEAARFCNHLSGMQKLPEAYREEDGHMYPIEPLTTGWRLPTEAEWELCARQAAPKEAMYPWGGALPPKTVIANLGDESLPGSQRLEGYNDKFEKTAPVGSFPADSLGLFDMAGNVGEWCHDFYSLSAYDAARVETDPAGPAYGIHHIIRGSGYRHYTPERLRIAFRDYSSNLREDVGFRVCRFAPKP